jgi:hypothetical protein
MWNETSVKLSPDIQLYVSTADEEANYSVHRMPIPSDSRGSRPAAIVPGMYRIIDGELLLVVAGPPPTETIARGLP